MKQEKWEEEHGWIFAWHFSLVKVKVARRGVGARLKEKREKEAAATKMQSMQKGKAARRSVTQMREEKKAAEEEAARIAVEIKAAEEEAAAITIQSNGMTYLAIKAVDQERLEQTGAAMRISAMQKGKVARRSGIIQPAK